jgi:hypothetical protein
VQPLLTLVFVLRASCFVLRASFFFLRRKSWALGSEVVRLVALVPPGSFAVWLWGTSQIPDSMTAQPPAQ